MAPLPLSLVIVAAVMHAAWNLLLKRSGDKASFAWVGLWSCVAIYAPVFFVTADRAEFRAGFPFAAASGALQGLYLLLMCIAFTEGDLSVVYPLSRAVAAALIALLGVPLFDEELTHLGVLGIVLVSVGLLGLHVRSGRMRDWRGAVRLFLSRPSQVAVLAGLVITAYHLVDKAGVGRLSPVPYIFICFLFDALFLTGFIVATRRSERVNVEWRTRGTSAVAVGMLSLVSYLLVLWAMRLGGQVSYIGSLRNFSVAVGAILGVTLLREPHAGTRIPAACLIVAGIVCIGAA
ncbi:MAG: EamA family transporter [Armatimonadota bacterium]